jgi:hypothetical protein
MIESKEKQLFKKYVLAHGGEMLSSRRAKFLHPSDVDTFLDDLEMRKPAVASMVHVSGTTVQLRENTMTTAKELIE